MARQRHIYETAFDSRVKQRDPDQDLDRMAQSPVLLSGLQQQQPRAGPLYPVPSSSSSSGVTVTPGRKGGITRQPSLQDACGPKPPPHQGSSSSTSASSNVQQQPAPTPRGSSSSGNPSVPIPATRGQGLASKQASAADKAIYQNHPLPQSPISENPPAAPLGAVAVKRSIHAGVKGVSSASTETDNAERRLSDNSKRHPAVRPLLQHNQSPSSDTRPESDYDRPWDLPRIKRSNGPGRLCSRPRSTLQLCPSQPSGCPLRPPSAQLCKPRIPVVPVPAPTASSSSGGGPSSSSPSVAMMASSSSSSSNTSIAMESPAAGPAARPSAPARPMLNLNLNLNASNSPKRSRHNLTLNFGCAALSVVGEKIDTSVALEKQGWYHGSISRLDAENLLRVLKEGSYLVRNSESSKHDFSLSLKSARGFMHMKIVHNEDGKFILGQFSKPFESIPEMIHHYSVNKLPIKGAEHMSLLYPVIDQLL
nr:cell wall protein RBR3-like [Rhipicephalus microplus]